MVEAAHGAHCMRTIPALLDHGARTFGDHPAVVDGDTTLSYADLPDAVDEVSRAYLAVGVRPGDRVAIWAPNRHEFILSLLGAQNIGAAVVPLNTRYRGHEARDILARSRARVLVTANGFLGTDYVGMLERAGDEEDGTGLDGQEHLSAIVDITESEHPATIGWKQFTVRAGEVSDQQLAAAVGSVTPDTIADIMFTSGTTGTPKGVMSAHRQTVGVAVNWANGAELSSSDRYAIVNPFFHGFGYKAGVMTSLTAGATIYPVLTFDPIEVMALIERERITVMPGAPTLFITLINHPRLGEFDLSSLRFATAGAASVPETLFAQMRDVLGFDRAAQAYGLTECVVATQSRPGEDPRHIAETTGPAVPGIEIRVVDPTGTVVPVGTDGEILLRGDNVMIGYFEDPEATAEAIDEEGWFHSGDVGRLDEHGCLKITDRIKDMFTVGGFNVYPAEVENVLATHPEIMECAVIGIPDERMGTVGRAYVLPRPGATVDGAALTAHCRARLANFKVPREVVFVDEFPRNAAGKILKKNLREHAQT